MKAVLGPILAPFMLLAMGIASWAHNHYGVDENMAVIYIFGAMLLAPIVCFVIYRFCQLLLWMTSKTEEP